MDTDTILDLIRETCEKAPERIFTPSLLMETVRERYGGGRFSELGQAFDSCGSASGNRSEKIAYYIGKTMACFFSMLENPNQAEEKLPILASNFEQFEKIVMESEE